MDRANVSIALPTFLLLLLLLPGILLSYAYRRGFFYPSRVTLGPLRNEFGAGIIWSLVLHPLFLSVTVWLDVWQPDGEVLLAALSGSLSDIGQENIAQVYSLFVYAGLTSIVAFLLGGIAHLGVRWGKLDIRFELLRFNNEWFYLFSGEARLFGTPGSNTLPAIWKRSRQTVENVHCSAVVPVGEDMYLYDGILSDYHFDADGALDSVVLQSAQRIPLDGLDGDDDFTSIPGDFLLIRYEDMKTLNVMYNVGYTEEDFPADVDATAQDDDAALPEP